VPSATRAQSGTSDSKNGARVLSESGWGDCVAEAENFFGKGRVSLHGCAHGRVLRRCSWDRLQALTVPGRTFSSGRFFFATRNLFSFLLVFVFFRWLWIVLQVRGQDIEKDAGMAGGHHGSDRAQIFFLPCLHRRSVPFGGLNAGIAVRRIREHAFSGFGA